MINGKIKLDIFCVLSGKYNKLDNQTFQKNSNKLVVPVVTISINDNIKFLENLKQGDSCEITTQPKNNKLDYMIDPKLRNTYRQFALSFKNNAINSIKDSLIKYYMPLLLLLKFLMD